MVLLFTTAAIFEARNLSSLSSLSNGDIWWHLRTGIWILQNHVLPHSGLFSQSSDAPWSASSWAYDVLLAFLFRMLQLRAIPILLMVFKCGLAVVTFVLAGGLRGRFWPAVALSAAAQYILGNIQPGPVYCSLLLFAAELLLLRTSRTTRSVRPLFWLAPLFVVWANLDIQFVYGVLLLILFLAATLIQDFIVHSRVASPQQRPFFLSPANAGIVVAVCGIATVVTPYGYRPYGVFFASVTSAANRYLPDFHAMGFRRPQDYALMLLTMAAFLALGLRRSRDLFKISLITGCAMLAFYAQRNAWLVVLAAILVIGDEMPAPGEAAVADKRFASNQPLIAAGALSLAALIAVTALQIPRQPDKLMATLSQGYPVAACDYISEHHLPQPLFNPYEWGGFVTWYLPEYPVAIDGRASLYGQDFVVQYFKAMNADEPYSDYPAMSRAGTLLLQRNSLMGEALSTVPAFRVAYSDNVAVVLVKP